MSKNSRSWVLGIGVLCIVAACIFSYITTRPDEANVSFVGEPITFAIT